MKIILIFMLVISSLISKGLELSSSDLSELKENSYIIKRNLENKSGFIVFDINKNINLIMNEIINLEEYPNKIADVSKVKIYEKIARIVKANIYIDNFFISFNNRVVHYIDKENYTVKWKLDYSYAEENYFSKMDGYWKLKKIDNNSTRVFYLNNLEFKSWIPGFIEDYLFEKGLFESTYWLKEIND